MSMPSIILGILTFAHNKKIASDTLIITQFLYFIHFQRLSVLSY